MDFEQVYVSYFNDVYRYLYRLSGDTHIAEEFTAETFFKALRSLDTFRGECDMRVWLCQIAKISIIMLYGSIRSKSALKIWESIFL